MRDAKAKAYEWVAQVLDAKLDDAARELPVEVLDEVVKIREAHERAAKARSESLDATRQTVRP